MKTKSVIRGILIAIVSFETSATAQNLVTNGSFEQVQIQSPPGYSLDTNDIPGWIHIGDNGDALLWRVGYADISGNVTVAGDGLQFVTLGGGYLQFGTGSWSQTLHGLTPGLIYQLSFKMASEGDFSGAQSLTVVFPSGSSTAPQTFSAGAPTVNYWTEWEDKSMDFLATNTEVVLEFTNGTSASEYDVALDSVSVIPSGPRLTIEKSADQKSEIGWSTNFTGYKLEFAAELPAPNWSEVTNDVATAGDHFSVTVEIDNPSRFYRLRKP